MTPGRKEGKTRGGKQGRHGDAKREGREEIKVQFPASSCPCVSASVFYAQVGRKKLKKESDVLE
jgi:hypothetical protein